MRKKMAYLKDLLNKTREQLMRAELRAQLLKEKIHWLEKEISQ